jgi:hypothetical protein
MNTSPDVKLGRMLWGPGPLPQGAALLGTVTRPNLEGGAFNRVAGDVALSTMKTNERRAVRDAAALAELLDRITERGHHAEAEE